jgi:beta-phosphoglucomutase-like phosphatase (HAD superfamily)
VTLGFRGVIFDVDGVLVASPHERAWRESLRELMATEWRATAASIRYSPEQFTTAVYQEQVAGKPRLSGARAALDYFHVPDADERTIEYAERKQRRLEELTEAGEFVAFADALRFALALKARGVRLAAASSSMNANVFLARIRLDVFAREENLREPPIAAGLRLLDLFDANVCGRDLPQGKPHPLIFRLAAEELRLPPPACVVVEDASVGIRAAKAGGMTALGLARVGDETLLAEAGADLVVSTLGEVALDMLAAGRLERRPVSA